MAATECDSTKAMEQNQNFSPTDKNKAWLETILKKNSKDEEMRKIVEYKITKATAKGDNYTSDLTRVALQAVTGDGRTKKLSVIIKELPSTEYKRIIFAEMGFFIREIAMYRDIIPKMNELMEEFDDFSEPVWGKSFACRLYDRIVLQDLTRLGYKMNDRMVGLGYPECSLVMKNLARFHALSVILRSRQQLPMEIFGSSMYQHECAKGPMSEMYKNMLHNFITTIETQWEPEWKKVAERFKKFTPDLMNTLASLLKRDDNKFNVLNHGDCWLNNIMLKYDTPYNTNDKPLGIKFVDYQLCFFNSPGYDLNYFFATTPTYEVRLQDRKTLVEEYHKNLVNFLKLYNYKDEVITLENLLEEMKRLSLFSLITGLILLPLILVTDLEKTPDIEAILKQSMESKNADASWLPTGGETYKKYMQLILNEVIESKNI